jgi:uncharacterized RDD family membrane protein YckC
MSAPETPPPPASLPSLSFAGYAGAPGGLEGVPFWPRVGARLIDLVAHYIIALAAGLIFGILLGLVVAMKHLPAQALIEKATGFTVAGFLLALLGSFAYEAFSEGMGGTTLGKKALGMTVIREDSGTCDLKAASIRSLAYFLDSLFFGLVGYLEMNKTPQQQRHGDRWARTVVVRNASLPAGAPAAVRSPWGGIALGCAADGALIILSFAIKLM